MLTRTLVVGKSLDLYSGGNYRWFRDQFANGETYAMLDFEAARIPPGAEGITSYRV